MYELQEERRQHLEALTDAVRASEEEVHTFRPEIDARSRSMALAGRQHKISHSEGANERERGNERERERERGYGGLGDEREMEGHGERPLTECMDVGSRLNQEAVEMSHRKQQVEVDDRNNSSL